MYMPRKSGKNPVGRPQIDIDKDEFEKLCGIQCTKQEIADFFGVSEDTIERWCYRTYNENFAVIFRQKRGKGKVSLRRSQWRLAETNVTMAIFLGKNYLNQSDNGLQGNESDTNSEIDPLSKSLEELGAKL